MEFLLWLEFCSGILAVVNVASVPIVVNFPSATVFPPVLESLVLLSGLLLMCSRSFCWLLPVVGFPAVAVSLLWV